MEEGRRSASSTRRSRGSHAGLNRAQIVAAARALGPSGLTMQAVAAELGVDRKALHHHVSDRAQLVRLVALTSFAESFSALASDEETDWRRTLRDCGRAIRDSVVESGALVDYFQFHDVQDPALVAMERVLQNLVEAGFTAETALRAVSAVADYAFAAGHDAVMAAMPGGHPQDAQFATVLPLLDGELLPTLAAALGSNADLNGVEQFDFGLQALIEGLTHHRQ